MRARHAGSSLKATGARCCAIATTSSIVSLRPPITTAALFTFAPVFGTSIRSCSAIRASLGAGPEIEEVEPLVRCLAEIVFETHGIALRPLGEMLRAFAARQVDALGERFEIETVAVALFQTEEQVDRTAQRMREHIRTLRERRGRAEKLRFGRAPRFVGGHAVA